MTVHNKFPNLFHINITLQIRLLSVFHSFSYVKFSCVIATRFPAVVTKRVRRSLGTLVMYSTMTADTQH